MSRSNEEQKFLNDVGKKIRLIRLEKEWSQERLAFMSNLDRTYIGGIERGEGNPTALNLKKIADALETPINDFFTNKN